MLEDWRNSSLSSMVNMMPALDASSDRVLRWLERVRRSILAHARVEDGPKAEHIKSRIQQRCIGSDEMLRRVLGSERELLVFIIYQATMILFPQLRPSGMFD